MPGKIVEYDDRAESFRIVGRVARVRRLDREVPAHALEESHLAQNRAGVAHQQPVVKALCGLAEYRWRQPGGLAGGVVGQEDAAAVVGPVIGRVEPVAGHRRAGDVAAQHVGQPGIGDALIARRNLVGPGDRLRIGFLGGIGRGDAVGELGHGCASDASASASCARRPALLILPVVVIGSAAT